MRVSDVDLSLRLTKEPDLIAVLPTPDLLWGLTRRPDTPSDALSLHIAARRYQLKERFGNERRLVYILPLYTAIRLADSHARVTDMPKNHRNTDILESNDILVVSPTVLSADVAISWALTPPFQRAPRSTDRGDAISYVDTDFTSKAGELVTAALDDLKRNRNNKGKGRKSSKPAVTQEMWNFLVMASALNEFGPDQVFFESTDAIATETATPHDDYMRFHGQWTLGLPDAFEIAEIPECSTARLSPQIPPKIEGAERLTVVDANRLAAVANVHDLLDFHNVSTNVIFPATALIEVARKAIFPGDTTYNSHRDWQSAENPQIGVKAETVKESEKWASIIDLTKKANCLRVVGIGDGAWEFLDERVWTRDEKRPDRIGVSLSPGTSDLLVAAHCRELQAVDDAPSVNAYTTDRNLIKFLESEEIAQFVQAVPKITKAVAEA